MVSGHHQSPVPFDIVFHPTKERDTKGLPVPFGPNIARVLAVAPPPGYGLPAHTLRPGKLLDAVPDAFGWF